MQIIYDIWIYLFVFVFGAILGSFLNVLIIRSHEEISWWKGRSKCLNCGIELTAIELIPILSFLIQKGRCKKCKVKISLQYPLVEFASAFIATAIYHFYGITLTGVILFITALLLLGDFVSDWRYMELPEIFNLSLIIIGIIYQVFVAKNDMISVIMGIVFGFVFFYIQYLLSNKQGIGEGDLRLGIIIGLFLAWPLTLYSIFTSYIIATMIFLPLIVLKKVGMKTAVPLGVFLIPVFVFFIIFKAEISSIMDTAVFFNIL